MALHADGAVRDLAVSPGGTTLYLAGAFTAVGGAVRYNFASIAIGTRTLTAWNPNIHASGWGVALSPDGATAYLTTADGNESICGAAHESVIAMPAGTAGTPPVLWHNGGAPGCPFNSGDINAVEATAGAVYIGGHLTNLCTVRNTSYTLRCPGALTVRTHVAALDPATGVPLAWNPGASGTRGVLTAQALPGGLAIGGDFQGAAGTPTRVSPCSRAPPRAVRRRHRQAAPRVVSTTQKRLPSGSSRAVCLSRRSGHGDPVPATNVDPAQQGRGQQQPGGDSCLAALQDEALVRHDEGPAVRDHDNRSAGCGWTGG